ncbi:carbon monoxide dehydrogenase [Xylophilus rhododendri]|uniref:Carbon monoxide dehydrogenase n=1 Tax=Xylophilus rhododendri TaxID=2697032 RepID=A0A857J6Q9_9BURK|nr:FAD binding domain-containing protein [Xylophilus rhododendri]QHI99684.1 carbon monoxide dehydrogenase [Xylophilus rhododendri]
MKAALFDYTRPADLQQGLQLLAEGAGDTKPMGGSQSLGPMLNLRLARPRAVVDVSRLPGMREVTVEAGALRIGGSVTHAEIEDGVFPELRGTLLQTVAAGIAYRAVRNRGTVAGSLAHADPAADWVLAMTALAARLEIVSASGKRLLPMERFMLGAYTTALEAGELIAAVHIPRLGADARWGYTKFCRKPGEFAEASCCAVFDADSGFARIVIGALDGAPRALPGLAAAFAASGALPSRDEVQAAIAAAAPGKDAVDRKLIAATLRRCLEEVLGHEKESA